MDQCAEYDYQKDEGVVVLDNMCVREAGHKDKVHIDGRGGARPWIARSLEDRILGVIR